MASPSILSAVFGLIIILFCGCSDNENTVVKHKPTNEDKTVSSAAAAKYVRAAIKIYLSPEPLRSKGIRSGATALITDLDEVNRLAAYFPDAGQGKKSNSAGGWMLFAEIEFETFDGKKVEVGVDPAMAEWAEKHGDWPIADAEKFRPYFLNLLRTELREPDTKDQPQKG